MNARLTLLVFLAAASPAVAAQPFDGQWSMSASATSGTCAAYNFDVSIVNGVVQTPPNVPVTGSGRVTPKGDVAVNFAAGNDTISASGKAKGAGATGRWSAPTLACAGTWQAQRR